MLTDGCTDGRTHGRTDNGRKVITIAHPEQSSGELTNKKTDKVKLQGSANPSTDRKGFMTSLQLV